MKNAFYLSIALAVNTLTLQAQDIHFSNTEYAPLILNPALAGANSPLQANLAYRTQWGQLGSSFRTAMASFDARVTEDNTSKTNFLALGVQFFNDRIGEMGMATNSVSLAVADHIRIDSKNRLSLAINGGYAIRSFDNMEGRWASQFDGVGYNGALPSGEDFSNQNFGYFDLGAGVLYTFEKKVKAMAKNVDKRVNVGIAAYHLTRPNNSFIDLETERLPVRYTGFINADISVYGTSGAFLPGVYYQRQGNFSQLLLGTNYRYSFNKGSNYTGFELPLSISLGLFARVKDSFIGKLMIDWDRFSVGYAYDFTYSRLSSNSNPLGASEIFVRFNMGDGGGFRYRK